MKKFFYTVLFSLFLISCGEQPPISEQKMEDFLVDYYAVNSAVKHAMRENPRLDKNAVYASLIKEHGFTVAEIDSAFAWYGARPLKYAEIYERVVKRLEKKKEEIEERLN